MSRRIFISHAVADKQLADAFVDLLQTAAGASSEDIFCSSLEGLGIPTGVDFIGYIKDQIQKPELVVALISPNYLASQFCLCELGAAWAMSHRLYPLLVPPLCYSDVQGVLKSTQQARINDPVGLSEFANYLKDFYAGAKVNLARWDAKKGQFLKRVESLLTMQSEPAIVPLAQLKKVQNELAEAKAAVSELNEEVEGLEELVKALRACKDAAEVDAVEQSFIPEAEGLNAKFGVAKAALGEFSRAVSFVAYCEYSGAGVATFDAYKDPDTLDYATQDVQRQYLDSDGRGNYSLNHKHPRIKALVATLGALQNFLEYQCSRELATSFERKFQIPMDIRNRELWECQLDPRLARVYA